jgi:pyruvate dehydrogenase E2 component (dihydrolipoamide acetyltransferase)
VIDGADAGRFLNEIKSLLSDPMMLLLSWGVDYENLWYCCIRRWTRRLCGCD